MSPLHSSFPNLSSTPPASSLLNSKRGGGAERCFQSRILCSKMALCNNHLQVLCDDATKWGDKKNTTVREARGAAYLGFVRPQSPLSTGVSTHLLSVGLCLDHTVSPGWRHCPSSGINTLSVYERRILNRRKHCLVWSTDDVIRLCISFVRDLSLVNWYSTVYFSDLKDILRADHITGKNIRGAECLIFVHALWALPGSHQRLLKTKCKINCLKKWRQCVKRREHQWVCNTDACLLTSFLVFLITMREGKMIHHPKQGSFTHVFCSRGVI